MLQHFFACLENSFQTVSVFVFLKDSMTMNIQIKAKSLELS